jgi:DNA-binding XRE family transcriptional regulator
MTYTTAVTPGGEEIVIVPRREFERMRDTIDAQEHARVKAEIAAGVQEMLSEDEVVASLAEPTPLAFWRKKRGLTQRALAEAAGVSQSYLAGLEGGKRRGDPVLFLRLSRALRIRMEDIVAE